MVSFVFEEDTSEVTNVDAAIDVSETGNLDDVFSEASIVGSELTTDDVDSSIVEDEETDTDVLLYAVGIDTVEDTDVGTVVLTELLSIELCVTGVVVGIPDVLFDLSVAGITVSVSDPDELAELDADDFETVEYVRVEVLPVTSFTDVEDDKELSTDIEGVIVCIVSDVVNTGVEPYIDVKEVLLVLNCVEEIVDVKEVIEDAAIDVSETGNLDDVFSEASIVGSELTTDDVDLSIVEDEEIDTDVLLYAVGIDTVEDTDVGTDVLTELFSTELSVIGIVVGISVDLDFSVAGIIIVASAEEVDSETTVLSLRELVNELEEINLVSLVFEEDTSEVTNVDVVIEVSETGNLDDVVSERPIVGSELITDDVDSETVLDEETAKDVLLYAVGIDTVEDNDVGTVVLTELFSIELFVTGVVVGISVDLDFSVAGIIIVSSV